MIKSEIFLSPPDVSITGEAGLWRLGEDGIVLARCSRYGCGCNSEESVWYQPRLSDYPEPPEGLQHPPAPQCWVSLPWLRADWSSRWHRPSDKYWLKPGRLREIKHYQILRSNHLPTYWIFASSSPVMDLLMTLISRACHSRVIVGIPYLLPITYTVYIYVTMLPTYT